MGLVGASGIQVPQSVRTLRVWGAMGFYYRLQKPRGLTAFQAQVEGLRGRVRVLSFGGVGVEGFNGLRVEGLGLRTPRKHKSQISSSVKDCWVLSG